MTTKTTTAFDIKWKCVWMEDECRTEGDERIPEVWERLYNEKFPNVTTLSEEDQGDTFCYLAGERMIQHSFDGSSIWEKA